jgi:hypothetical protein
MTKYEKLIHRFIISMFFSLISWLIINNLIVDVYFYKYMIIEILLLVMLKLSTLLTKKLGLWTL